MSNIKRKIVAIVTALTFSLSVAGPAWGATVEELQAQINALLAQLSTLQAQLAALTGAPAGVPAACAGITFTVNLTVGSSGNDVKCLQAYLNVTPQTGYFGPLTKAAVISFQEQYAAEVLTPLGLTAGTGFVGAKTRAKLNALLVAAPPVTPPVTGKEGTLAVTAAPTPIDADIIYVGQEKKAVAGLYVKALGSDVKLSRIDINFTTRPWLNISTITIADGTTDVISYDVTQANTIEVTVGSAYTIRITGLNITVPDGTTKTLNIKVNPKLVVGDTSELITYQIPTNGLRGTDGAGIDQYAPSTALTARTFTIATASGALALSTNAGNPVERAVIGSASAITENVELLRLDVKATINDVIISKVTTAAITDTDGAGALQTLKLYDGDTLLAATSTVTGQAHVFSPLNLRVSKDTTKTLSIKADIPIVTAAKLNASTSVSVAATGITSADAGTFASITASGATAAGNKIHLYTTAPSLALVSTSIATTREGRADASNTISAIGKIKFNVTALGGDVYVGTTTGTGITAAAATAASTSITSDYTSNATVDSSTYWLVRQAETKWFEVTSLLTNTTTLAYFTYVKISQIKWGTTTSAVYTWDWSTIPLEYRTSAVYLQGTN